MARVRPSFSTSAILAAVSLFTSASHAASLSGPALCSANKAKAAGRTMICLAKEQNVELQGTRPANFAACFERLANAFAKAEAPGACAVSGDLASAQAIFAAAAAEVFDIAGGTTATTQDEIDCAAITNRAASRFASCRGKVWARWIATSDADDLCGYKMGAVLLKAFRNGCPDTPGDLALAEGPAASYLPGVDVAGRMGTPNMMAAIAYDANFSGAVLEGADLHYADVSGADFTGADLYTADFSYADASGADFSNASISAIKFTAGNGAGANFSTPFMNDSPFTGADLQGATFVVASMGALDFSGADLGGATFDIGLLVDSDLTGADFEGAAITVDTWDNVVCPDGTNSDDHANTCCGHHVGGAPASCGP